MNQPEKPKPAGRWGEGRAMGECLCLTGGAVGGLSATAGFSSDKEAPCPSARLASLEGTQEQGPLCPERGCPTPGTLGVSSESSNPCQL